MDCLEARQVFDALCGGKNPNSLDVVSLLRWIRNEHARRAYEEKRDAHHDKLWGHK